MRMFSEQRCMSRFDPLKACCGNDDYSHQQDLTSNGANVRPVPFYREAPLILESWRCVKSLNREILTLMVPYEGRE
jgi:hypothetical protein